MNVKICEHKEMIESILSGDERANQALYVEFSPMLLSFFSRRVEDEEKAAELVQDTFISIFNSLARFEGKSSLKTWIYSIAHHELVDYYRKKKIKNLFFSHFPFLEDLVDKALSPQLALEEKEAKQKIFQSFQKISEGYCSILRLKYIEELSVDKIAQKLQITYKAAESRLTRARSAFVKIYQKE